MGEQMTAAPGVTGYHHLGLTVCDVDRSEEWYGKVFGFQRAFVEPHHEGTGYAVVMNIPGTPVFMGLDKHDAHEGEQFAEHRTGLDHLGIGVATREDLDRWVAHLDALGVAHSPINDITEPFPAATLCFRDPDNIALELMWM
jgi:catechol 2,3-dioxygenase-like lactoylglutathione lyase family enzyme